MVEASETPASVAPSQEAGRSRARRRLVGALRAALLVGTVTGLIWLLDKIGWAEIGAALARIGFAGALVIGAIGVLENLLDALALSLPLRQRTSPLHLVLANSTGAVINALLPWDLGEVAKAALLHERVPPRDALSAIIIFNYVFKISRPLVALSAALLGVALGAEIDATVMTVVVVANVAGFLPYLVLRLLVRHGIAELLVRLLGRLPPFRVRHLQWLEMAQRLDHEVQTFHRTRPRAYRLTLLAQIAARVTSFASLWIVVELMGLGYSFGLVAVIYAALNMAEFLITVLPARLGVAEGAAFGVFTLFGLDPATGVILYIVLRLKALGSNGLWLPLALVRWRRAH